MKKIHFTGLFIIWLLIAGFAPGHHNNRAITIISFKHWVGNKELKLIDETYTNPFGEPFVISKFKYYISHIAFTGAGNKEVELPGKYYLINEADSLSKIIQLPAAGIKSISFFIGVDSIKNISGVQTGCLDPVNGMFWTWNSGYIFARLEGSSDVSSAPAHSFGWDVGGFRKHENALRKVKLLINTSQVSSAGDTVIVNADVLKWFNAVHPLKISKSPVCHQPGQLAMQIADNYSAMFSIAP